jgi:hypothetical protein
VTDSTAPIDPRAQGPATGKSKIWRRPKAIWTVVAVLAAFFIGLSVGLSGAATPVAAVLPAATVTVAAAPVPAVTVAAAPVPAVTVTVAPPAPPAPAGPASTITEGTWTVGTDIVAGAYRTTAAVTSGCYWQVSKSGSNGISGILSNGNPTGGFPTVTLKVGQDFTTQGCGDWAK